MEKEYEFPELKAEIIKKIIGGEKNFRGIAILLLYL
jgi:hypothetical protein